VELACYLGPMREHLVRLGPDLRVLVREPTGGGGGLQEEGAEVTLHWDAAAERLFGADGAAVPQAILQFSNEGISVHG